MIAEPSGRLVRGAAQKPRDRRAQMGCRIVPEFSDLWMPVERGLDNPALNATAAAVNDTDLPEARDRRRLHVFVHDRCHVLRGERVKIELRFNRDTNGVAQMQRSALSHSKF